DEIRAYLNRYLPEDIAVTACDAVDDRFHARLNAKAKRYVYRIWNSATPNVFERKYLCRWEAPLDTARMQAAAARLVGEHDFKAFCGNKRMKKSTVRTIYELRVERIGDEVRLTFYGTGFLQYMVRILTGTLVEIGEGKRAPEEIDEILASRDRAQAGITMPPQGLTLDEVIY
ncbi:MAG: tRNA pseudouridine synthase A, partial [Clostridiales bacterium]|nr:tRNA pseudouridine synthase A [Clostridiales bacterium]